MKKKLVLNKQIIANLNNPDRIFGGGDRITGPDTTDPTVAVSCLGTACLQECVTRIQTSCGGHTCPTQPGEDTCKAPNGAICDAPYTTTISAYPITTE